MAALHYAAAANTTSLHHNRRRFTTSPLNPRKPILLISCISTPFPSKPTTRKNHLRQKILKTLPKPRIPKLPPADPIIPIDSPPLHEIQVSETIQEIQESEKSENSEAGNQEFQEFREVEVTVPDGGNVGILAKNPILKYGLWLVGAFVFQTVCAIWVFGSADKNEVLNGNEESSVLEVRGKDLFVDLNELEMGRKIEEIKVMAREAREKERLESKKNGLGSEDSDENKSVIEEEVDNRLNKLKKKLENTRGKTPVALGGKKGELDVKDGTNAALLFKKKYKFKGVPSDPIEKPKGFIGSDDKKDELLKSENGGNRAVSLRDGEKQQEPLNNATNIVEDDQKSTKNTRKKVVKERGIRKQGTGKGFGKTKVVSSELSKGNESLKGKGVEDELWWSNLPYVLTIFMRRGNYGEGGEGLYTLKSIYKTEDHASHMVAFEDRVDATNFCYLLQSFFEDLEDFKAEVVPLPIKELKEAVEVMGVIVVKKGQLRLYAGQPLADAEMALRAMIKQA